MIRSIQLRHTNLHTLGACISTTCIHTTPSAVCLCDNIGLVSLILLGWELHVSYITVLCVQDIPILSLAFYAIPIFHIRIFNLLGLESFLNVKTFFFLNTEPDEDPNREVETVVLLLEGRFNGCC